MIEPLLGDPSGPPWFRVGGGVVAGAAVGYFLRFTSRFLLLILGASILLLYSLTSRDYVTVNWDAVGSGLQQGGRAAGGWLQQMVEELGASLVGFAGGLLMGWRMR